MSREQPIYANTENKWLHPLDSSVILGAATGTLHKVNETMNKEEYFQILEIHLKSTARQLKLGHNWVLQQHNDPKHQNWLCNG